jgi:SAM-dependent methyltransferase
MSAKSQVLARPRPKSDNANTDGAVLFQEDWAVYRKIVDNNCLFHREAYETLHRFLVTERSAPFRFADLACGDSGPSVGALRDTAIAHYFGVDASAPALALAETNIAALSCPATLAEGDFAAALAAGRIDADVIWIGLSLHHFRTAQKLELIHAARRALRADGSFLIYENASPGHESRAGWLKRWDLQRSSWQAFSDDEWEAVSTHVHERDFPETDDTWRALGTAAGFGKIRRLYICPTDLFRLYCFQA